MSSIKMSSFSIDDNGGLLMTQQDPTMIITLEGEVIKGAGSIENIGLVTFEKAFLVSLSKKSSFRNQEWALLDVEVLDVKLDGNKISLKIKYSDKVKLL